MRRQKIGMSSPKDFIFRLKQAERFGMMAVRETCGEEIKNCGSDGEKLAELSNQILQFSIDAWELDNQELSGTYDLIRHEIAACASSLSPREYHRFCEGKKDFLIRYWL